MINWLVQTQGYELSDLYDDKKVKKYNFLKSLREEITDYTSDLSGMVLTVTFIDGNLNSLLNFDKNQNIKIKSDEYSHIGLYNSTNGDGCLMSIEIEKDLVIPKEWCRKSYHIDMNDYSINGLFGLRETGSDGIEMTNEEPIKIKPANIKKIKEIIKQKEKNKKMEKSDSTKYSR